MAFAPSIARLSASGVLMFGLGAPLRMPMPTPTRLMGVPSPPAVFPSAMRPGGLLAGGNGRRAKLRVAEKV